jgi:ketopantoate hydroxymethyltransferase
VLQEMIRAMSTYAAEVRTRAYPGVEHSYGMAAEELAEFRKRLGRP